MISCLIQFLRKAKRAALAPALAVLLATPAGTALADGPLRIVVPFPAGSATDALARVLANELGPRLGVSVMVDNKPGAGGIIGAEAVKTASPDGNTLLLTTNTTQAANKSLFKQLPYDPVRDFAPVGKIGNSGMVLMVRPDFPARNVQEFVAEAKLSSKGLAYGHGSAASQVSAALFLRRAQVTATAVAYKGIPNAVVDLIGGHIDFVFVDLTNALGHIQSGKLKALAVTMDQRASLAAAVPTLGELPGFDGLAVNGWFALMAPVGVPAATVARLTDAMQASLQKPDVRDRMTHIGILPDYQPPARLAELIQTEVQRWSGWVQTAGIQAQ